MVRLCYARFVNFMLLLEIAVCSAPCHSVVDLYLVVDGFTGDNDFVVESECAAYDDTCPGVWILS